MENKKLPIDLIYCGASNKRFAQIAIDAGWKYGAQLPGTIYYAIDFADQNWKKPDRQRYMEALAKERPQIATVLDLETHEQIEEVLNWAEEAAQHVTETVIVIPKAFGAIQQLPEKIGNKEIRLGYSIPTRYAGTEVPLWEFGTRPVHLLGGNPHYQMELTSYLNVKSVDCNWHMYIASKFGDVWLPGGKCKRLPPGNHDNIYVAFEQSCKNILQAWHELLC